jgi:hypothetical protein
MRLLALSLLLLACDPPRKWEVIEVDPARITVMADKQTLRHDVVGVGRFAGQATFVLVDARNQHTVDAEVTLGGELIDAAGQVVGTLRPESLRIPTGARRTFALVDDRNQSRPTAVSARVRVVGATETRHVDTLSVDHGTIHKLGDDRLQASAILDNRAERHVTVIVLGAFYDGSDRPVARQFSVLELDGHTSHPVEFTGPPGSTKGYIFTGQLVY